MKTPFRSRRQSVLFLLAAVTLPLGAGAAEGSAPPPSQVLFMGTDLFVQHGKKLCRVEDVMGSDFKIRVDGQEVYVPTRRDPIDLHVDADLKLSGLSVQLDELQAGAGYTYGNDPRRKLEEANRTNMAVADMRDNAVAAVPRAEANLAAAVENAAHNTDRAAAERDVSNATSQLNKANQVVDYTNISTNSDSPSLGQGAYRMALAEGQFDAMEVSFKVSSPVELNQPYMVILFKFHDPAAKPGVNGLAIHAQALDPIDAKPHYVRVLRGGLPTAFTYVDCSVHIFNRGQELATNRSDKRVELTRDETQQYLVMQHVGAHKGATLPAAAVPGMWPRAWREGLTHAQLTRTIYVKVGSDGVWRGVFSDADCKVPLEDAGTKTALGEIFFTPALEAGKQVDGVARVRLSGI